MKDIKKMLLVILIIIFASCTRYDITNTVEITYLNGVKDTLKLHFKTSEKRATLIRMNKYGKVSYWSDNQGYGLGGVREYRILKREVIKYKNM